MANKVGPLIKEARTAAGLTQEQLAKKVDGVTAADLSKAERGEKELTQAALKQIAKVTGVTQSSLVNAAKESTYKKTSSCSAKTSSAKKTSSSKSSLELTATEKKLVELYRAADTETKKTAMGILKGEPLELSTILSSLLSKASDSSGKEGLLGSLLGGGSSSSSGGGELLESLLSSFGKK